VKGYPPNKMLQLHKGYHFNVKREAEKRWSKEKLEHKHPAALHTCEKGFTVMKERII